MDKKTYGDLLRDPKWRKKRLEILNRDEFTCRLCGDKETTLNVHHIKYAKGNPWETDNIDLITLCEHCHKEIERHKRINLYTFSILDINNNNIRILKSDGWEDECRIMFLNYFGKVHMTIYERDEVLTGFEFRNKTVDDIALIFLKTINFKSI